MTTGALEHPTLVLNRNWTAINVVPVRRALVLVCRDAAKIILPETYETFNLSEWEELAVGSSEWSVRMVSRSIRVPEVIVLASYDRPARLHVPFTRRNLYRRDQYTCQYCSKRPGSENLSIDHVVPRSAGGRTTWENCVLACLRCNIKKSDRSLAKSGMKLLKKPTRPRWIPQQTLPAGIRRTSWRQFVSDRYWEVELIN